MEKNQLPLRPEVTFCITQRRFLDKEPFLLLVEKGTPKAEFLHKSQPNRAKRIQTSETELCVQTDQFSRILTNWDFR